MFTDDYEELTPKELGSLERYVTNTTSHIFALRNLPEVIKGALFSRYSRSMLGLRTLLLKEFISAKKGTSFFQEIAGDADNVSPDEQLFSIKKAQQFYDRILDGYGDDSIGELGGAHLALENISMIAAKAIQDCRIGGSPLEKSTRYIYFDKKINGEYPFYREPVLMTSAYRDLYLDTCNNLFDTYSRLIPPLTEQFEAAMPQVEGSSTAAYKAALRAKVLDCLRGLLPASTLTNMGVFGNGRFFEQLLHKLHVNSRVELQDIGRRSQDELGKVIPSFIRRADPTHTTHERFALFFETMNNDLKKITAQHQPLFPCRATEFGTRLITYDPDAVFKVAAALLFPYTDRSLSDMSQYVRNMPEEDLMRLLDTASSARENRRHKSPRALEHAHFTFELLTDFGAYRDLQRHRLLSQEKQLITCKWGYFVPEEIEGTEMQAEYEKAMDMAKIAFDTISQEFPEEAEYVVPMAYRVRWYMHLNLRALQWLTELRSSPAGHPAYRLAAQSMAKQVCDVFPAFERFFRFVDYEGYDMGRLDQEERKAKKEASRLSFTA